MSKSPKVKLSGLREKPPRLRLRAASFASTSSSMDDGCDPRRSMTPKNRLVFDESSFKTPVMSPTLFEEKKHSPRSENIRARIMSTFRQKTNDRRRKSLRGSATILNFHFHDLQITPKTPTSRCRLAKKGFK
ncbi:unnamed protein product, partial [Mesorhabditis belari]|uniref:Uncharacterized protein n=1 Tax=Mesorhabditis belari TaxID=2138241 RepID=A0AAF3FIL6_9BILA